MEQLQFEDYEELACDIADKLDALHDEFGDVSVIAKYNEAKEIIKELLCFGYNIASVELRREELKKYLDEYIVTLNFDGIWCEEFKYGNEYLTDASNVIYIMDNCSSAVIPYCKSKEIYEVSVDVDISDNEDLDNEENSKSEHEYTVKGKKVDKEIFDKYVSQFTSEKANKEHNGYSISVKCNIDVDDVQKIFDDIEREFRREMIGMVDMMYYPQPFFYMPRIFC